MPPPGKSVLLIDDNRQARSLVREILCRLDPHGRFYSVENGELGVEHLERAAVGDVPAVDLVLVDRQMPRLDGFDVLTRARLVPALAAVPIIMVTGSNDRAHIERARRAGASDFRVKPPEEYAWAAWLRDLLLWRPEFAQWAGAQEIERDSSALATPSASRILTRPVSSVAMPPNSLALPVPPMMQFLATAAAYLGRPDFDASAMQGLFADPDEMDITFAERQARVTRAQVVDREGFSGHDMDGKRWSFFSVLYRRAWALPQIHARFPMFSRDYLKKIRTDVHKSSAN